MGSWNEYKFEPNPDEKLGYVVGVTVGDGWTYVNKNWYRLGLKTSDKSFADYFAKVVKERLGARKEIIPHLNEGYWRVSVTRKNFVEWFQNLCLESMRKLLLDYKEFARGFLRGFYDSEGWCGLVNREKYGRKPRLFVYSCNKKRELLDLCKEVLLTHFGIRSQKLYLKRQYGGFSLPNSHYYLLKIEARKDVYGFLDEISFRGEKKRKPELLKYRDCPTRYAQDCLIGKLREGRWP